MHVPCPDCNSTNLQKVSLACEEVLYQCDNRAQFHGVLGVIGGPGVLVRASTTNGTRQKTLSAQRRRMATRRFSRNTAACLLSTETFVIQSQPRGPLLNVCWPHANKIVWHVELFGPNHEME